jgi:hypothetical protein
MTAGCDNFKTSSLTIGAIPSCARKYTVFSATVIALSSLLQTLLTDVERLDLSFGAMMAFWWSALAACL